MHESNKKQINKVLAKQLPPPIPAWNIFTMYSYRIGVFLTFIMNHIMYSFSVGDRLSFYLYSTQIRKECLPNIHANCCIWYTYINILCTISYELWMLKFSTSIVKIQFLNTINSNLEMFTMYSYRLAASYYMMAAAIAAFQVEFHFGPHSNF